MAIYNNDGNQLSEAYDLLGQSLESAFDVDGQKVFEKNTTIKVMSYNVGQWYIGSSSIVPTEKDTEYYALQNGMIQNADADILCICEYRDQFSETGRTALSILSQYYPYIETSQGGVSFMGRAICSKYPISNFTHHVFNNGVSDGRYYDSCTITINDEPITVVVTHLVYNASSDAGRIAQMNELISYFITLNKFICCGDFNTLDCKSTNGSDYINMILPILNAGFHCANCTDFGFLETYSDQPAATWTGCLDNIITSSNIAILSAEVDETKLNDNIQDKTDHMPLIAELRI